MIHIKFLLFAPVLLTSPPGPNFSNYPPTFLQMLTDQQPTNRMPIYYFTFGFKHVASRNHDDIEVVANPKPLEISSGLQGSRSTCIMGKNYCLIDTSHVHSSSRSQYHLATKQQQHNRASNRTASPALSNNHTTKMPPNVLVTGASGYLVGSFLAAWAADSNNIITTGYDTLYALVRCDLTPDGTRKLVSEEK
ncbi:hypothetical protein IWX49DRAFT_634948 [Phyllosticta citricarpa]